LDKGHGRAEIRTCKVIHELNWIDKKENWKGMKNIIKITSERMIGDSHTIQDRYYISSLQADAAYFNQAIRTHWGIENQLHWQLDVGFGEDLKGRTLPGTTPPLLSLSSEELFTSPGYSAITKLADVYKKAKISPSLIKNKKNFSYLPPSQLSHYYL
jgi:hypothetical protein